MAIEPVKDTDPTIGRLVTDASRDISTLISKEIALAKSELKVSVRAGGMGLGLFAAAGFISVLAVIMLSVAIAYFINWNGKGLDLQWAFLISKEIALAKSELKVSVRAGGLGLGLFAAAGFISVLAVIMLSVAIAYFINWNGEGLALQWAFLIVFGSYLLLAALLGFIGVKKVKKVRAPEKAIAQGREIPKALKGQS